MWVRVSFGIWVTVRSDKVRVKAVFGWVGWSELLTTKVPRLFGIAAIVAATAVCPGQKVPQWSLAACAERSGPFTGAGLARMSDRVITVLPIPISSQINPPRTSVY